MLRCGKDTCTTCPHGPYTYVLIRTDDGRRDVSLGRHPSAATFYRRLADLLPAEQISQLIDEWRKTHDRTNPI
jgi:hypothetical protein